MMLKVLTKRIGAKVKHLLKRNPFGFWKGCDTRDAVEVMSVPCIREVWNVKMKCIYVVDFEKAFYRVNWVKMFEIMKSLHSNWRDRRWLEDLHMRQEAMVRSVGGDSDPGVIGCGVRQGCPLSPLMFSIVELGR